MSLGYRKLGRNSSQRKAMFRDLITDLILNGHIETTYHRAKELQRLADKMVTLGKQGDFRLLHYRRFEERCTIWG